MDAIRQSPAALLRSVLNSTLNGVVVYYSLRQNDQIIDFEVALLNDVAEGDFNKPGPLIGQTMRRLFADVAATELIGWFRNVVETGQRSRFEFTFTSPKNGQTVYYDVLVVPLDDHDGVVVSYNNVTAIRQAEQEKQRQAERLQFVTNSALTAIALYSIVRDPVTHDVVDLRYELVNQMAERMTGRRADELIGKTMRQAFPGVVQSGLWAHYYKLATTGEPLRLHNHYAQDGYDLWYEVQGVQQGDYVVLSFLDITELKESQQTQQRQADLLQNMIDTSTMGLALYDVIRNQAGEIVDFRYAITNPFNARITGRPVEELVGGSLLQLFPSVTQSLLWPALFRVAQTGEPEKLVFPYFYDGVGGWFDSSLVRMGQGVLLTFVDITAVKQAELAQQRQAEHLQYVLDSALAAIVECKAVRDEQGQIIDFVFRSYNRVAEQVTGLRADDLIGKRVLELFPTARANGSFERWTNVVETGEPVRYVDHYQGEGLDVYYEEQLVKFDDGFIQSYVDISPLKRQQQELEQINAELQRSNENLQSFAYVASHDLQEPLRKIQAFGDMLVGQFGPALGETGQDYIRRMQGAAERMAALIKDLLTYSRITTHRQPFVPVNLNRLLTEVLLDLETAITDTQAVVNVVELPTVPGDALQLRQLWQNLLSNALKFHQPGQPARVDLRCRRVSARDVVGLVPENGAQAYYQIDVVDNGIGFDEKYLDRIFQVFQRLHGKQQFAGTGVGLAICKKVVENHGGAITARSQPGAGTTFTVYLPAGE